MTIKCREAKVMELSEAHKIIQLLSEGIAPETGEVLEDESTFNRYGCNSPPLAALKGLLQ